MTKKWITQLKPGDSVNHCDFYLNGGEYDILGGMMIGWGIGIPDKLKQNTFTPKIYLRLESDNLSQIDLDVFNTISTTREFGRFLWTALPLNGREDRLHEDSPRLQWIEPRY